MSGSRGWPAPAKVNRFLRVLGRRDDGYHLLQSLFQFLDWQDLLEFELLDSPRIERGTAPAGITAEADLCLRAARLLQTRHSPGSGVRIYLNKTLPMGSGLGGGSSDAATVLVALNRLWGLDLPVEELAGIALELGADVPVFVHGQACWAEGVGEQITPVKPAESRMLLLTPPAHVSTGEVFAHPKLNRTSPPLRMALGDGLETRIREAGNDCLPLVEQLYPEVGDALDFLRRTCGQAYLSGTGASVFALLEADVSGAEAESMLANAPCPARVARLLNRSPLLDRLEEEI